MSDYNYISERQLAEKFDICSFDLLPESIKDKICFNHRYEILTDGKRDEILLSVISNLNDYQFRVSGENDNRVWEKGWGEVLSVIKQQAKFSSESLIPQYFSKENVCRLFGEFVISDVPSFSYDIDYLIRSLIFSKYLIKHDRIVEMGSGTGNSQYLLAQMCPQATELLGSDWSTKSLDLLKIISNESNRPIQSALFNMLTMEGYKDLKISSNTAVFTVHALEQIGKSHKPLLTALIESKPAVCVHIEPIKELYEKNSLVDYLAIKYHDIRNYLDGWLTELKSLDSKGIVKIIEQKRIRFGNKYHEAYNLVVWKPC